VKQSGSSPVAAPRSFSVAPAPRVTERSLVATGRAVRSTGFHDFEHLNDFLRSEEGQRAMKVAQPEGTWERAQDLAYDAWEATGPRRYQLAREALVVDERCSDAWLILAEQERAWHKQKRCFDRAVKAAERFGQDEELFPTPGEEEGSSLYRTIPGRTIMRAYLAQARCQIAGGYRKEAQALYTMLLDLDPEDHMGVRHEVVPLYHVLGDLEGLRALLNRYPHDAFTIFPCERLWLAITEDAGSEEIDRLEQEVRKTNPFVLDFLLGNREMPARTSQYVTVGGEDEAADYAEMAGWWRTHWEARMWLMEKR
jgi:tetratricopeptide (TPR) repeat protein